MEIIILRLYFNMPRLRNQLGSHSAHVYYSGGLKNLVLVTEISGLFAVMQINRGTGQKDV